MTNWIAGPGLNVPVSSPLYPDSLQGAARTFGCYQFVLHPGGTVIIPSGEWIVSSSHAGASALQWYDGNVTGEWRLFDPNEVDWAAGTIGIGTTVWSDGVNYRVANLTDSAFTGIITDAGTGYVQATTTVTAGTGNSTWNAVVGGALSATVTSGGANYSKPPIIVIPQPQVNPSGTPATYGKGATAYATISGGAVTGITFSFAGAGYTKAPPCYVIPDPFDPNINLITPAVVTLALTGSGTLTAVLLANFGEPLTSAPTLTVNGAGSSATATTSPSSVVAAVEDVITLQRR